MMTKQDIMNLTSSYEIMKTLFSNPELWDEEVNDRLKKLAKEENKAKYGVEEIYVTLPRRVPSALDEKDENNGRF